MRGKANGGPKANPTIRLNEMASNGGSVRRKSEAATHVDSDSAPHRHEGGKKHKDISKEDSQGEIFERMAWLRKRNEMLEICAVPLFIQKAMLSDWVSEFDCGFREFDSWPLSDF